MSDCIPHAVHVITGLPIDVVMENVRSYGWTAGDGMSPVSGWYLIQALGFGVTPMRPPPERVTVSKLLPTLDSDKIYVISVREHWFVYKNGTPHDKAKTHGNSKVERYFEVSLGF